MKRIRLTLASLALLSGTSGISAGETQFPRVLTQQTCKGWIFFCRAPEGCRLNDRRWTNIIVKAHADDVTGRVRIDSRADAWLDVRGHAHSTSVLKLQLEYNLWLKKLMGRSVNGAFLRETPPKGLSFVGETGILDKATLEIPIAKLRYRFDAVAGSLHQGYVDANDLSATDPGLATARKRYLDHWQNEVMPTTRDALNQLQKAIDALPLRAPLPLDYPTAQQARDFDDLKMPEDLFYCDDAEHIRQVPENNRWRYTPVRMPEKLIAESADSTAIGPALTEIVVHNESLATRAVERAEQVLQEYLELANDAF